MRVEGETPTGAGFGTANALATVIGVWDEPQPLFERARALLEHEDHPRRRLGAMRTGLTIGPPEDIAMTIAALGAGELCNVYGSTETDASKHFLGWLGDVDPDALFDSGAAWGISVMRRPV